MELDDKQLSFEDIEPNFFEPIESKEEKVIMTKEEFDKRIFNSQANKDDHFKMDQCVLPELIIENY